MPNALFLVALLLCAFLVDRFGPWWLQALCAVAGVVWFVVGSWRDAQRSPRR